MNKTAFHGRLRALRKRSNLTQAQLGQLADVDPQMLSKYERGATVPTAAVVARLAKALGSSMDYLWSGVTGA